MLHLLGEIRPDPHVALEGARERPAADRLRKRAARGRDPNAAAGQPALEVDRKSTRLNSSHTVISYAVFCLKKKKQQLRTISTLQTPPPRFHLTPSLISAT